MKSQSFLDAKPKRRTDMVVQGYEHLAVKMESLASNIKVLNAWLRLMPGFLANDHAKMPDESWRDVAETYAAAGDKLTAAMVENANLLKELNDAIQFYNKYDQP